MSKGVQFTREGFEKLKHELDDLRGPVRLRIAEAIREAKSHGDLKENAAYHEAKLNQTRLEARIAELERGKSAAAAEQARLTAELDTLRREAESAAGVPAAKRGKGLGSDIEDQLGIRLLFHAA